MRGRGLVAAALLAGLWPMVALAYRPFEGTDAAVAPKGEVEIELAPVELEKEGAGRTLAAPSAVLNLGLTGRAELVVEGKHLVQLGDSIDGPRSRVADVALALKGVLREGSLQDKPGVSVATEVSALLPPTQGRGGTGAELALIASQRWPDLTLHLDGAAAWTRAHRPSLTASAILEVHEAWAVRPVFEALVRREPGEATVISGLAGAIWRVRDGLAFDAGVRLARAGDVSVTELRAGLTWGFGLGFLHGGS